MRNVKDVKQFAVGYIKTRRDESKVMDEPEEVLEALARQ